MILHDPSHHLFNGLYPDLFKRLKSFPILRQDLVVILEAMRIIAIALSPVTPSLGRQIYAQLGYSEDQFDNINWVWTTPPFSLDTYA